MACTVLKIIKKLDKGEVFRLSLFLIILCQGGCVITGVYLLPVNTITNFP